MELAALAAWVGIRRQISKQTQIEFAAGKVRGKLFCVHAGEAGAQAAGNHLARQRIRRNLPEREDRFESSGRELLYAIASDVFQKQIAESDSVDLLGDGALAGFGHALLINFVGAGPRKRNDPERQTSGRGLGFEHRAAYAVHGDAIELGIQRGDQAADFDGRIAAQRVQRPRAVFAAAPGEKNALHRVMIAAPAMWVRWNIRARPKRLCNAIM